MLIEIGDLSDLGEAWVRYKGNRRVEDYRELLERGERVDPTRVLTDERAPRLVHYYDLPAAELEQYSVGGCWVFRVLPRSPCPTAFAEVPEAD
ncbi:hypothetical protein [Nocardioides sp. WS12]|uniref:hypothetical protein n=1 Tax=Nocardioides sp. WS12 TaxID=2486272 RepID=UPI0015F9AD1A|nr:hypothetical protein [Nocardioides sp. WS12]